MLLLRMWSKELSGSLMKGCIPLKQQSGPVEHKNKERSLYLKLSRFILGL